METVRLSDINLSDNIGNQISAMFVIQSVDIRPQKNGGEYAAIVMRDKSVTEDAKIFGVSGQVKAILQPGKVYAATIEIKEWSGGKNGISCVIKEIGQVDVQVEAFADWHSYANEAQNTIIKLLTGIENPTYNSIVKTLLSQYWSAFVTYPAGRKQHHTELGSLVVHTAEVATTALKLGKYYNEVYAETPSFINIDLLLAGALLHDIGKLHEYVLDSASGNSEVSVDGVLKAHIVDGIIMVNDTVTQLGLSKQLEEVKLLTHLIASHHGRLEWGSPVSPATPEAQILHICDMLSAQLWKSNRGLKQLQGGKYSSSWSGDGSISIYKEIGKGIKSVNTANNTDIQI